MTQGWRNLRPRAESELRALEKHYREIGYSDGYALLGARSPEANYQAGWWRGRAARKEFDDAA